MADAILDHALQHAAQGFGGGGITDDAGRRELKWVGEGAVCIGDAVAEAWRVVGATAGDGVHHGGDLQGRGGEAALPEAEHRQLAGALQFFGGGQHPGAGGQVRSDGHSGAKA